MSGDVELVPPAAPKDGPGGEVVPLAGSFTAAAEEIPATHIKIRVYERDRVVGTLVLIGIGSVERDMHLVVGEQEWFTPDFPLGPLGGVAWSPGHFAAVSERLLQEAMVVADRMGASLSTAWPGSVSSAERLAECGFRPVGDLLYRERVSVRVVS